MESLAIVFGDQLDPNADTLSKLDREQDAVLMMEVADEATHVRSHRQRTVLFLAAMRHFAVTLHDRGHRVEYVRLDDGSNTQSFDGEIKRAIKRLKPSRIIATHPGEWRVLEMLRRIARQFDGPLDIAPDGHFLTSPEEFEEWAADRKDLVMENFYRWQRRRLDVLMDGDEPVGGEWNFDKENRESFKSAPDVPRPYTPRVDDITNEVIELVAERFPDAPGSIDSFRWPVKRDTAKRALDDFIKRRLPHFGRFQDAMWTGEPFVFHALLSPALNLKLLDPRECVSAAVDAYHAGHAPINAVEGFVRQIIGWREFIRGVYWLEGPSYGERNELDQHGSLPSFYWSGETEMNCMRESIGQVLEHGFGHHIQRLMVTGNFALIAGVHPRSVSDWYLGMYVDAVDWVTLPNTLGMVMHADGGVVGTKPYAASGKYIKRMSNYCDGCRFDSNKRTGERACPFNTFYWDFLICNRRRFARNRRMSLMLKQVERLDNAAKSEISSAANELRTTMGISSSG